MSTEITKAFVEQYNDNVLHLLNQEGSLLRDTVRSKTVNGKAAYFERLGRGKVVEKTSRHSDTPQNDVAHSRRKLTMKDYIWSDLIDEEDEIRMLINPRSEYAKAAAWDMGEKMDKIIVEALNGNSESVDEDGNVTQVALPTSQIVDEDLGAADSNLTFEKLNEARHKIRRHSGNARGTITMVVNSSAMSSLLSQSEIQSIDTNTVRALVAGEVDTFMGFKFVVVSDGILPGTADGTDADPIKCFAYLDRSLGLGIGRDITTRMDPRADKNYSLQVHSAMTAGAVRIEEEGVVAIECVQSA